LQNDLALVVVNWAAAPMREMVWRTILPFTNHQAVID
jgi:hypothetical protein